MPPPVRQSDSILQHYSEKLDAFRSTFPKKVLHFGLSFWNRTARSRDIYFL
jgi:hypothetical protein